MQMKPILFNPENVRKILAGTKTMTRRVIEPPIESKDFEYRNILLERRHDFLLGRCPYGQDDALLWVQEKWCGSKDAPIDRPLRYKADYPVVLDDALKMDHAYGLYEWQAATIMPFWASRIKLLITRVHVELLHDMAEEDARKEGCTSIDEFRKLWDSINGIRGYGWEVNPAVYVIEFKRVEPVASSSSETIESKWTTMLPTEPGMYWVHKTEKHAPSRLQCDFGSATVMVHVLHGRGKSMLVRYYDEPLSETSRMYVPDFACLYDKPFWQKVEVPELPKESV